MLRRKNSLKTNIFAAPQTLSAHNHRHNTITITTITIECNPAETERINPPPMANSSRSHAGDIHSVTVAR